MQISESYNTRKNRVRVVISILVSVSILYVLFQHIELEKLTDVFRKINLKFIYLAMGISLMINLGFGAYKWQRLLLIMGCRIRYNQTLFIFLGNAPARLILPLKMGSLALASYLSKYQKFSFTKGVSSIIFDKLYNLLGLALFVSVGLMFFDFHLMFKILGWCGLILVFCIFFYGFTSIVQKFLNTISSKLGKSYEETHRIMINMAFKQKLYLFVCAVIFQGSAVMTTYLIFKALNISVPFYWLFLFVPLTIFISQIPITISGLGTREAVVLFFYSRFAPPEALLNAGILISFIGYIFLALVGSFLMYHFTKRLLA